MWYCPVPVNGRYSSTLHNRSASVWVYHFVIIYYVLRVPQIISWSLSQLSMHINMYTLRLAHTGVLRTLFLDRIGSQTWDVSHFIGYMNVANALQHYSAQLLSTLTKYYILWFAVHITLHNILLYKLLFYTQYKSFIRKSLCLTLCILNCLLLKLFLHFFC